MKTLFTLTLLLFSSFTFAQTDHPNINKIRKIVEQINKDSACTIKKLDNDEFLEHMTDEGGQLTGYFKNGQLVKIIEWIGLSSCADLTEYYLQDNKLIFTYTKGSEYSYSDSLGTFDRSMLNTTMECRFYFDNHKIIKMIFKGSTRCGGQPTVDLAKKYLDECSRYTKLLTKK
jgi:hypothetical protein